LARGHPNWSSAHARRGSINGDYAEVTVIAHPGYAALRELLLGVHEAPMFLTYHLIYPPGTRIITVSRKPPLPLLYKEMAPLPVSASD